MGTATESNVLHTEAVLDSTEAGMLVLDQHGQVLLFNQACEELTACNRRNVLGKRCFGDNGSAAAVQHDGSLGKIFSVCQRVLQGPITPSRQQFALQRPDGTSAWIEASYTPLSGTDNAPALVLVVLQDVTEAKQREEQITGTQQDLASELERLRGDLQQRYGFSTLIARSAVMQDVLTKVQTAGKSKVGVLISGEAGTGKELIARTIHFASAAKDGRFVPINCSSQTAEHLERDLFGYARGAFAGGQVEFDGMMRSAEGGTIYLDEVASMSPTVQDGLLRALETGHIRPVGGTREVQVSARVIAATCQDPAAALADGSLRRELLYRMGVISIQVPPLRRRFQDIPYLVAHFTRKLNRRGDRTVETVAPDAWEKLLRYDWPGNVTELQSAVETAHVAGSGAVLQAAHLPELVRGDVVNVFENVGRAGMALDDILASVEKRAILAALRRSSGQRSLAARTIGISRSRLYRRMEALGIRPREDL
ncbi:MAG: sigma-54 interaction domain-containing protein [Phycisphaerae bacterium]